MSFSTKQAKHNDDAEPQLDGASRRCAPADIYSWIMRGAVAAEMIAALGFTCFAAEDIIQRLDAAHAEQDKLAAVTEARRLRNYQIDHCNQFHTHLRITDSNH